jgi:hypothetical protein
MGFLDAFKAVLVVLGFKAVLASCEPLQAAPAGGEGALSLTRCEDFA